MTDDQIAEKLLRRIDDNFTLKKRKAKNLKSFYINGDLRILGSKNLYGIWNSFIFKLHKKWKAKN